MQALKNHNNIIGLDLGGTNFKFVLINHKTITLPQA